MVTPSSRWSWSSPTQRMGRSPALRAACTFWLMMWSVSPKRARRSLWPMMTYFTSKSASIPAEISPVKGPLLSQWRFWAPTATRLSFRSFTAAGMST